MNTLESLFFFLYFSKQNLSQIFEFQKLYTPQGGILPQLYLVSYIQEEQCKAKIEQHMLYYSFDLRRISNLIVRISKAEKEKYSTQVLDLLHLLIIKSNSVKYLSSVYSYFFNLTSHFFPFLSIFQNSILLLFGEPL